MSLANGWEFISTLAWDSCFAVSSQKIPFCGLMTFCTWKECLCFGIFRAVYIRPLLPICERSKSTQHLLLLSALSANCSQSSGVSVVNPENVISLSSCSFLLYVHPLGTDIFCLDSLFITPRTPCLFPLVCSFLCASFRQGYKMHWFILAEWSSFWTRTSLVYFSVLKDTLAFISIIVHSYGINSPEMLLLHVQKP